MSQSLSQIYVHLIFSTKERFPFINPNIQKRLYEYIAATLKSYESPAIKINGMPEHIHILFRLSKNYALAKVIEEFKKQSSKWLKEIDRGLRNFSWQNGYGAFSVSSSKVELVKNYIVNQKEHHKKLTFQEEVQQLMKEYEMLDFDEKYFWK